MKQSYLLASSLFLLFSCVACEEDDKMDMDKIDVPNGYALSAGTSTIFLNSSVAYDTNADWITGANSIRFNNGDGLYDDVRAPVTTATEVASDLSMPVISRQSPPQCRKNQTDIVGERRIRQLRFLFHAGLYLPSQRCFLPRLWACIARSGHLRRQTRR